MRFGGYRWVGFDAYDGTNTNRYTPLKIMDNVVAVSAGFSFTLATRVDGSLWAWGQNEFGQLGDGTATCRHYPIEIMDNTMLP